MNFSIKDILTISMILFAVIDIIGSLPVLIDVRYMKWLEKLLGTGGINILRKVFGVVQLAIAVKLFRSNVGV